MKTLYLLALAVVVACATTGGPAVPSSDRNVITETELSSVPAPNLYDLIEKLRPNFLRSRGQTSFSTPGTEYAAVYVDGQPYGDLRSLRTLIPSQVGQVRYYDAPSAAAQFGIINATGVIDVTTRR